MQIKRLIVGEFSTNCYLLESGGELGVVDPGGEAGRILGAVKSTEAELKYIINTHYHPDHILANKDLRRSGRVEVLIHETEKEHIDFKADRFLLDGDEIKIGETILRVIHTPGHSGGSICLLGQDFIFTGDTLFKDGYGRTDLPSGSSIEIKKSLELLSRTIKPGMMVYPGHGEVFRYGPGMVERVLMGI